MPKRLVTTACFVLIMLVAIAATPACAQKPEPDYAGPITESILLAANAGNYAAYSERFSDEMKSIATEAAFEEVNALIKAKIGDYVSKEFWKVETEDEYTIVSYKAKFTQEPEATVRVIFQTIEGEVYVAGLWVDSPKLRQ